MKKRLVAILIILSILMASIIFSGCSRNPNTPKGTVRGYSHAMLTLPDGTVVSGKLDSYDVYSYGTIKVVIDGITYRAHSVNVVLTNYSFNNEERE